MKEQIMEKLFNNVELTSEDLIYIGKNHSEGACAPCSFDHESKDVTASCGITKEDCEEFNRLLKENIEDKKDEIKTLSLMVERFEMVMSMKPKFQRLVIMNYIHLASRQAHSSLLSMLLGGRL